MVFWSFLEVTSRLQLSNRMIIRIEHKKEYCSLGKILLTVARESRGYYNSKMALLDLKNASRLWNVYEYSYLARFLHI